VEIRAVRVPSDLEDLDRLFRSVHEADSHWPLGEHKYLDLQRGRSGSSVGLVGQDADGALLAYVHLAPNREAAGWGMEMAVEPSRRTETVMGQLLDAAQERVRNARGARLSYWLHNQEPPAALAGHGFVLDRELHQLRRPLPVDELPSIPPGFVVRGFERGADEDAWLEVNNLAFVGHPENGNWTQAVFEDRISVGWFDPAGFRTVWHGDRMAAFNWTKVHPDGSGEIYVIAVHPDYQRMGLGRAIAVDGLIYLHDVRGCRLASLYVDSSNAGGMALYTRLGFDVDHTDRAFTWVPGAVESTGATSD